MLIFSKNHAIAIQLLCETVENSPLFPFIKKKSFKAFHLSILEKEKKNSCYLKNGAIRKEFLVH